LVAAATRWTSLAWQWEDGFIGIAERTPFPGGAPWHGVGADAAVLRTTADRQVVSGIATQLYTAARVAREGAEDIAGARQLVVEAIDAAQAAGFAVGEDLSVTSPRGSGLLHEAALRAQAAVLATEISSRVEELVAVDTEVAGQLSATVAGFEGAQFSSEPVTPAPSNPSGVQAVDYQQRGPLPRAPKIPSPTPDPGTGGVPDPVSKLGLPNYNPGSLSGREARGVYTEGELRLGELGKQWLREGMSPEQVARQMSEQRNLLRTWSRDIMADRGAAARITAGNPNMTWDQVMEKYRGQGYTGNDLWNKIIDSATRSRPSVNAAAGVDPAAPPALPPIEPSAPFNVPAVEPPAPVVEPVPGELPPVEGGLGGIGGVPATPPGPQFVPAPHSIHHPFPVLGEDDLGTPAEDFEP
jgi:hypothetical protein